MNPISGEREGNPCTHLTNADLWCHLLWCEPMVGHNPWFSCAGYLLDTNREDIISWTQSTSGVFTVSYAWNSIRPRKPPVQWHAAVWFSQSIKRHSFIAWLVIQERLSTQDKLLRWGLISSMACVYCQANEENRNHLFIFFLDK